MGIADGRTILARPHIVATDVLPPQQINALRASTAAFLSGRPLELSGTSRTGAGQRDRAHVSALRGRDVRRRRQPRAGGLRALHARHDESTPPWTFITRGPRLSARLALAPGHAEQRVTMLFTGHLTDSADEFSLPSGMLATALARVAGSFVCSELTDGHMSGIDNVVALVGVLLQSAHVESGSW